MADPDKANPVGAQRGAAGRVRRRYIRPMAWFLVVVAGLLETGFAVCLKQSHGFTRLWPTVGFCLFALGSFGLLTLALRNLHVGPAYAVWTGIGAAGTALLGMILFGEPREVGRIVCLVLIVAGTVGLKLFSGKAG